jgi:Thymidylate kinase
METKLIVFEGIDGSGKGTQCQMLVRRLEKLGKKVLKFRYPAYQDLSSIMIEHYLSGRLVRFGYENPYTISAIYAIDHQLSFQNHLRSAYEDDETTIILDRYIGSNIIHQMPKLPERDWNEYIEWIHSFEFGKLKLPRPDITFYMDIDPEISMKLITSRCRAQNISPDIHEQNAEYLRVCARAGLYGAEKCQWEIINCMDKETNFISPTNIIADQIWELLPNEIKI